MKKVIVTGASGFIGRHTLKPLMDKGFDVYGLVNSTDINNFSNCSQIKANLLNPEEVKETFNKVKPDYLLHLAWDVTSGKYLNSDQNFEWVQASIEIIKQFQQNGGKKAVFAGTCFEEYFKTPYGISKKALRDIMESYCDLKNINFSWGRIFFLYGPHENPKRLIPYVINSLLNNREAECTEGNQTRDFLHVEDVAQAFVDILESAVNGTIDICSGEPIKINQLINKIGEQMGKNDLIRLGARETSMNEPDVILGNNNRLVREVGWKPKYSIDKGIEQTIKWWKNEINS
ncbi:MAG TPA: NAD(P)-dependent oxidoreductase [Candidatus Gastranaerophilales bacterium]|nr:NAD(P)-dependent oxidoreductase [Candidatus Gastranaerophilales bacterium]